ncbi:MAG TPA: tryptophan 2,3-dioxygenase family protein [Candidatus Kapabacteria bacterium]|nr:tryptophan 2,3-dioxygenase family protein [Candidatus Kapabacteria bacterium]
MPKNNELQSALDKVITRYGDRTVDYLEGIAIRREIIYDDYIETDALLSLQHPLTDYHDELTFLIYHQQTELWFRLALHEMEAGIEALLKSPSNIAKGIQAASRTNRILKFLTDSFDVLIDGLDTDEFLEFRKAFGSSSGFQSAQFRAIEIVAGLERKPKGTDKSFYWEQAARSIGTGEPTLTLIKFKEKHLHWLNDMYEKREPYSFRMAFQKAAQGASKETDLQRLYHSVIAGECGIELKTLAEELLKLDLSIINWKISHLRAAAKHMTKVPRGTGDTNWAEYLSKSIQEEHYFPELVKAKQELVAEEEVEYETLGDA